MEDLEDAIAWHREALVEMGDVEAAVGLLEQGRAILWSKMQGFRHPLDKLRKIDGDLADEFDHVGRELEHHAMSFDIEPLPPGFYERRTKKHCILSERWDQVVQRIRCIELRKFFKGHTVHDSPIGCCRGPRHHRLH